MSRARLGIGLVVAGALSISAPGATAQAPTRPAFAAYLWLYGGPERDAAFAAAVRDLGIAGVHADRIGGSADLVATGLGCYADQLAGKGELELRPAQWRPLHERFLVEREALERPGCLAAASSRARIAANVRAGIDRTRALAPAFASIADEASATAHVNPIDFCGSAEWRAAFRAWLSDRHGGDVGALARRWDAPLAAFEAVEPWTTARIRARELGDRPRSAALPRNLAPWNDRLAFADELFVGAVEHAIGIAADADPTLPTGLFGMQPPAAFGGHDYARLMPAMGAFEAYDIGGAFDLADSFARPDALRVVTLFPPPEGADPRITDARLAAALAHGVDATVVWSAGDVFDAAGRPTTFGRAVARGLRVVQRPATAFAGARIERDPIWLVESRPATRAWWMWDSAVDGDTWPRRLSSYEAEHSTALAARQSWLELVQDLGLQARCVDAGDLPRRLADGGERPALIVLPAAMALSDAAVAALVRWVEGGGRLVADHGAALYDAALRRREQGGLDGLFGLQGRSFAASELAVRNAAGTGRRLQSGLAVAERGIRGAIGEPVPGTVGASETQVQIERVVDRGRVCYLNLAVCEYRDLRLDPERVAAAQDLRRRLRWLLADAGVEPLVEVRGRGLPTCVERIRLRTADGRRLLAVRLDALGAPEVLEQIGADGPAPVTLEFRRPVALVDEATGTPLGEGQRFALQLDPFGALWLGYRELR